MLRTTEVSVEILSDALLQCGAMSVSIEDANAGSSGECALYGEPGFEPALTAWPQSRLRMLADAERADEIIAAAGAATNTRVLIEHRDAVQDTDWVRATQAQFAPIQIGQRLWIVPTWHEPPQSDAAVVRLDPGVAFGTGTHPTTRLCLAWLDEHVRAGASVLDYGCGSGILAMAAEKLGAGNVVGTDIDPQALEAARSNARTNSLRASYTDPGALTPGATFDIVLANILSNPLRLLAPALLARIAPGGALVLCGILQRQADELIDTYRSADPTVPLTAWRSDEGWVCLTGTRPA